MPSCKIDYNLRTFTQSRFEIYGSVVGVGYLLGKRKSKPCAAFCARTGFVGAVKGLGYVKQLFLGHALAVILDNSFSVTAGQCDFSAVGAGLYRIFGEVVKEHRKQRFVTRNDGFFGIQNDFCVKILCLELQLFGTVMKY